jgi:hypothetical protein
MNASPLPPLAKPPGAGWGRPEATADPARKAVRRPFRILTIVFYPSGSRRKQGALGVKALANASLIPRHLIVVPPTSFVM